jgi:hypothetical protein
MHPEITRAIMTERINDWHAAAAVWRRADRVRRPSRLSRRHPRPQVAWAA